MICHELHITLYLASESFLTVHLYSENVAVNGFHNYKAYPVNS